MYQVLLYYKYVAIANPEGFAREHLALCQSLGLKGRVIVAGEGLNGTVSGTEESTGEYMRMLRSDMRFRDMEFKCDLVEGHVFAKLFVRAKQELVTLRYDEPLDRNELRATRLSPSEFREALESGEPLVLDGRSDYEYDIGHFRNAIRPEVETFREFPEWIRERFGEDRARPILTYCTGGIRCEKLTALLLREGFTDVSLLDGGIVSYGKDPEVRGKYFDGKCYVFDERIAIDINKEEKVIVGRCIHCSAPTERFLNCANMDCNYQHLCCAQCEERMEQFCSEECKKGRTYSDRNRDVVRGQGSRRPVG